MTAVTGVRVLLRLKAARGWQIHNGCIERCLKARGIPWWSPGNRGTPLGERLRNCCLKRKAWRPPPWLVLMVFAARAQRVAAVIQPALARESGCSVIAS